VRARADRAVLEDIAQILREGRRARVAAARVELHRRQADGLEIAGYAPIARADRIGPTFEDQPRGVHAVVALEGDLQGQQLVERDAQGVHVRALVDLAIAAELLGRHVIERPHSRTALGDAVVPVRTSQAEVEQHRPALGGERDIRWLHIAVQDLARVGVGERIGDLQRDADAELDPARREQRRSSPESASAIAA
jgi:hypothetical protein